MTTTKTQTKTLVGLGLAGLAFAGFLVYLITASGDSISLQSPANNIQLSNYGNANDPNAFIAFRWTASDGVDDFVVEIDGKALGVGTVLSESIARSTSGSTVYTLSQKDWSSITSSIGNDGGYWRVVGLKDDTTIASERFCFNNEQTDFCPLQKELTDSDKKTTSGGNGGTVQKGTGSTTK